MSALALNICNVDSETSITDCCVTSEILNILDLTPNIINVDTPNFTEETNTDSSKTLSSNININLDPCATIFITTSCLEKDISVHESFSFTGNDFKLDSDLNPYATSFITTPSLEIVDISVNESFNVEGSTPIFDVSTEVFTLFLFSMFLSLFMYINLFIIHREISSDHDSPHELLQALRLKNVDRIIIGHLNINSIRNKIGLLGDMVQDRIDILLVSETKIDDSFPIVQFRLNGYTEPYR